MKTNPGGEIAPDEVVGRDALIEELWITLETQSVVMVAERRMGKTSIAKKMRAEPRPNMHVIYTDVESRSSPLSFAEAVARDVRPLLSGKAWASSRLQQLMNTLGGTELAGAIKLPEIAARDWHRILEATLQDLADQDPNTTIIFVWDELPLMLDKIRKNSGEPTAMDVLDTLRALRQQIANLRMVFTGSVGLHHVLLGLRDSGHTNAPTNDMRAIEVAELDVADARALAEALLRGEGMFDAQGAATAAAIAHEVDRVPFYIHHIVRDLRIHGHGASPLLAKAMVEAALYDDHDPWDLEHFDARIDERFGESRAPLARAILDAVGLHDAPRTLQEIQAELTTTLTHGNAASHGSTGVTLDALRSMLRLLARDHYLQRVQGTPAYAFRFPLIQRWWRIHRGHA